MTFSFFVMSILNSFAMIFASAKLLESKINYKNYKVYLVTLILTLYSFFMYNITHSFFRLVIMLQLYVVCNWFLHKNNNQKIDKIMIVSLISWIMLTLCEILVVMSASFLWQKIGINFVKEMMGTDLPAIMIIVLFFFLVLNKKIINLIKNIILKISQLKMQKLFFIIVFISTMFSMMLYLTYFELKITERLFVLLIILIEYTVFLYGALIEKRKIIDLQDKIDNMITITMEYEKTLEENRINNHENKNQLIVIKDMIDSKNAKAIDYINNMIETKYEDDNNLYLRVSSIPLGGLRGLIYYKLLAMQNKNISSVLNVDKDIKKNIFDKVDAKLLQNLCKIVGVFLDNAIEAINNNEKKVINIELYIEAEYFVISISNEYNNPIDFELLGKKQYSSKGDGRGSGLQLVEKIVRENPDLINEKVIMGDLFVQKVKMNLK